MEEHLAAQDLAGELRRELTQDPAFARDLLDRVLEAVPDVGRDEEVRGIALAMIGASLESFAAALEHDIPDSEIEAPWLALKYARRLAWEGVTVDEILRGYRLGQEFLFGRLAAMAEEHGAGNSDVMRFVTRAGTLSFRLVDVLCTQVAAEFAAERETMLRGALARRGGVIRALLDGESLNIEEAERTLGYRLDTCHLGTLLWSRSAQEGRGGPSLDQVAEELAEPLGSGRPLVANDGPEVLACWFGGIREPPDWTAVAAALPAEFRLACGRLGSGLQGFCTTHRQAERARAVMLAASASRDPERRIASYEDVALASLLIADRSAARAFVEEELGPLAADSETCATLRSTLLAVLRMGGQQEASEQLFIHRNTVAQRLRKAEELLGRSIRERRQETEAALLISESLGSRPADG